MTNGKRGIVESGIHLNWAMVGVAITALVAGASFTISLGTVQTHVAINTDILKEQQAIIIQLREQISALKIQNDVQDRRIEEHRLEDSRIAERLDRYTTRSEAQQLLTQGLTELHIETKRLDQAYKELYDDLQTYKQNQIKRQ